MSGPTKGMVAGQQIRTGNLTKEYEEGYELAFGKDRKPVRGKFVFDPRQGKCVPIEEYVPEVRAVDAPILAGRFYENNAVQVADEKTGLPVMRDIGSRRRRSEFMKERGLADYDDFKGVIQKKEKERADFYTTGGDHKARREAIERTIYNLEKQRRR